MDPKQMSDDAVRWLRDVVNAHVSKLAKRLDAAQASTTRNGIRWEVVQARAVADVLATDSPDDCEPR
jgi:hypothetical protein